jgi:hypothetical protein
MLANLMVAIAVVGALNARTGIQATPPVPPSPEALVQALGQSLCAVAAAPAGTSVSAVGAPSAGNHPE